GGGQVYLGVRRRACGVRGTACDLGMRHGLEQERAHYSAVIARLDRAIQYSAAVAAANNGRHGLLDAPLEAGHDSKRAPHIGFGQMIIHGVPKRSVSMPKLLAKKVSPTGMVTVPPLLSVANARSTSAGVGRSTETAKPDIGD